jgi:glycine cleavage system transcriptional repressor
MREVAVTAVGADRPGIIARLTGALLAQGANLEDSAMTILGGQFAMMLLVRVATAPAELEADLAAATADLGLAVTVRAVGEGAASPPATHLVSVYGSDRPGIVHGVTRALADLDVNVTDLSTRVLEGEQPVYAMMLEVSLPDGVTQEAAQAAVGAALDGVEVSIHPLDVDTF